MIIRILLLLHVASVVACVDYVDVDPKTTWDPATTQVIYDGDPAIELGFYQEQLYTKLEDGSECPVVYGLQGGTWTMPALKTLGITPMAWVDCSIVTEAGEVVGETALRAQFFRGTESYFEIQSFPIPVFHTGDATGQPIDDLYGQMAVLTCGVLGDAGRSATYSVRIRITED